MITHVYCDGGLIERNPSPYGGTWAWRQVNERGAVVGEDSGYVLTETLGLMTNNQTEFMAAVLALEELPDGWSGYLCCDSQVTLGRLCWGWRLTNLDKEWVIRGGKAIVRLGLIEPILLQGHPSQAELDNGMGSKRLLPVSRHNVWCDEACQAQARRAKQEEIR